MLQEEKKMFGEMFGMQWVILKSSETRMAIWDDAKA